MSATLPLFKNGKVLLCDDSLGKTCCSGEYGGGWEIGEDGWSEDDEYIAPCEPPFEITSWSIAGLCPICPVGQPEVSIPMVQNDCEYGKIYLLGTVVKHFHIQMGAAPFTGTVNYNIRVDGGTATSGYFNVVEDEPVSEFVEVSSADASALGAEGDHNVRFELVSEWDDETTRYANYTTYVLCYDLNISHTSPPPLVVVPSMVVQSGYPLFNRHYDVDDETITSEYNYSLSGLRGPFDTEADAESVKSDYYDEIEEYLQACFCPTACNREDVFYTFGTGNGGNFAVKSYLRSGAVVSWPKTGTFSVPPCTALRYYVDGNEYDIGGDTDNPPICSTAWLEMTVSFNTDGNQWEFMGDSAVEGDPPGECTQEIIADFEAVPNSSLDMAYNRSVDGMLGEMPEGMA